MRKQTNSWRSTRRSALWFLALFTLFSVPPALVADDETGPPVSLNVIDADLRYVVRILTEGTQANVVIADGVGDRKVTCNLYDKPLEVILSAITAANNLYWHKENGIYYITAQPVPSVGAKETSPESPPAPAATGLLDLNAQSVVPASQPRPRCRAEKIYLQYRHPVDMVQMLVHGTDTSLESMAAWRMQQMGMPRVGGVVPASSAPLSANTGPALYEQAARQGFANPSLSPFPGTATAGSSGVDVWRQFGVEGGAGVGAFPGGAGAFPGGVGAGVGVGAYPGGVGATGVGTTYGQLMPLGIEAIVPYEIDNSLLVRGPDEAIQELRTLIDMLDKPQKQVRIEAEFLTMNVKDENLLGFDWSVYDAQTSISANASTAGNVEIRYARGNFAAHIAALKNDGRARAIIAPRVTTPNNVWATMSQTTTLWYTSTQTIVNPFGGATLTNRTPVQIPVSVTLSVLPRINGDNSVTMLLPLVVQDVSGFVTGPNGESLPIINGQSIQVSNIRVRNGETLVLGGLVRRTDSDSANQLPFFSDLPLIGNLFRSRNRRQDDTELLIFITPTVLPEEEAGTMTAVSSGAAGATVAPVPVAPVQ